MLAARHLGLCPLRCIYCVAPGKGVKEGGGEYELMSCCREEQNTNIARERCGREGEKDRIERRLFLRKMQIIEGRGVRREKEILAENER